MKRYVVTFLFDRQFNVWLIEKQKPEWQKDCLNGIGGKIEPNENSLDAAVRELKEEAGVIILKEDIYGGIIREIFTRTASQLKLIS